MSNKVFGVDLGTGFSCTAVIENGKAKVVENKEGNRTTPSVIYINETTGERVVGDSAKRGAVVHPKNTVNFIKRFIGADWNDGDVQKMLNMIGYDVVQKNGKPYASINVNGKETLYSPEELSSMVVQEMKKNADAYYGEDVKDVVITVPAWFNDTQRNATKTAGELAGLNVLRIINEPTSAILASDIADTKKDKIVAVVDCGCGTTDVSVCECSDGMIEVLASDGDVFLGGQNYDNAIVRLLLDHAKEEYGVDLKNDPMAYARIVEAAEKAKIELSSSSATEISLPYIGIKDNSPLNISFSLTRAKLEASTSEITNKIVSIAKRSVEKAGKAVSDVSDVLLVGGTCRTPALQDALTKVFGNRLNKSANFDEAVALGAATQAKRIANPEDSDVLLLDVTPISLGIETMGSAMTKIIDANTTIPCRKQQIFSTAADNQPGVSIVVLQGERPMSSDNKTIGQFQLDGIAPARRGVPQIEVSFDIDANGILSVSAVDKATGKEQHITINDSNSLSQEEVDRIKAEAETYKAEDEKRSKDAMTLNDAESYAYSVEKTVSDNDMKDKITAEDIETVKAKIADIESAVKEKDAVKAEEAKKTLEDFFNPIMAKLYKESGATGSADNMNSKPFTGSDNPFGNASPFNGAQSN